MEELKVDLKKEVKDNRWCQLLNVVTLHGDGNIHTITTDIPQIKKGYYHDERDEMDIKVETYSWSTLVHGLAVYPLDRFMWFREITLLDNGPESGFSAMVTPLKLYCILNYTEDDLSPMTAGYTDEVGTDKRYQIVRDKTFIPPQEQNQLKGSLCFRNQTRGYCKPNKLFEFTTGQRKPINGIYRHLFIYSYLGFNELNTLKIDVLVKQTWT